MKTENRNTELKYTVYNGKITAHGFFSEDMPVSVVGTVDTLITLLTRLVPDHTHSRSKIIEQCKELNWDLAVVCVQDVYSENSHHIWLMEASAMNPLGPATEEQAAAPSIVDKFTTGGEEAADTRH